VKAQQSPSRQKTTMVCMALVMACLLLTGCTIGVKEHHELLYVSPVPIPEASKGVPVIATDKPVPLGIWGKGEKYEKSIPGYVVVDPHFYARLVERWNKGR